MWGCDDEVLAWGGGVGGGDVFVDQGKDVARWGFDGKGREGRRAGLLRRWKEG